MTEFEERELWMMKEAKDRDRWLIESLDQREQHTRDWWTLEDDSRDEIKFHQMLLMVKGARCGLNEPSTS